MTTSDLADHVRDWTEVLHGIVPENELNECYLLAVRDPIRSVEDQKFPLRATEVLHAYRKKKAASPIRIEMNIECTFCKQYKYDMTEYRPCPFHMPRKPELHQ